jgi:phage gpG-like protein
MINITTSGMDGAREALLEALREFQTEEFVTVGIHEDTGDHNNDGISNAQLGAVHEFGTEHIPARPWLNPGVESGNEEYGRIIENTVEGGGTLHDALEVVGVVAVGKVKEYMTNLTNPPLKYREGNPLVDTGALRASVDYKIEQRRPEEGLE